MILFGLVEAMFSDPVDDGFVEDIRSLNVYCVTGVHLDHL